MSLVSPYRNVLCIEGRQVPMPYAIREAFALGDMVIVLLDPNSYLEDPSYSKDRRRGKESLSNLLAVSREGNLLWESELPEPVDYFYRILSVAPLIALSFSSFQCELDPETGKIRSRTFLK